LFSCENGGIRFGLVGLKNVGQAVVEAVIEERQKNGDFKSFDDFINRTINTGANKRMVESLILSGAFDTFGINRRALMEVSADYMERVAAAEKNKNQLQISIFGTLLEKDEGLEITYPNLPEYSSKEKLTYEKAVVGIYLSGHPLSDYKEQFDKFSFNTGLLDYFEEDEDGNKTYTEIKDGQHVLMGGIISEYKRLATKSGQTMAFVTLEDVYGKIEVILFPKAFENARSLLGEEQIVRVSGRLQIKEGVPQIIADEVTEIEVKEESKQVAVDKEFMGLIIPNGDQDVLNKVLDVCESYPGDIPVIVALNGKKYSAKSSVRKVEGLLMELKQYLKDEEIIFFKKKS
jgi:DNA polymerase-3 subunit alpha